MARSMVGTSTKAAPRTLSRRHRLWPSPTLRLPPGGPAACEPDPAPPPAGTLTARELIAMARAARLDRA